MSIHLEDDLFRVVIRWKEKHEQLRTDSQNSEVWMGGVAATEWTPVKDMPLVDNREEEITEEEPDEAGTDEAEDKQPGNGDI